MNKSKLPRDLRWRYYVFLLIASIGLIDAIYLTANHFQGTLPTCDLVAGCDLVLTSAYAQIGFIPVALLGALYYATVVALLVGSRVLRKERLVEIAALLTPAGFIASLWFLYLQFGVIKSVCQYCLLSAATSTVIFIIGISIIRSSNQKRLENPSPTLTDDNGTV